MQKRKRSIFTGFRRKKSGPPVELSLPVTVHVALNRWHRAYSVFPPGPYEHFPLFDIIHVLGDQRERSNSPRSTQVNLKTALENRGGNKDNPNGIVFDEVLAEFKKIRLSPPREQEEDTHTVSESSLKSAGITFASPAMRAGASVALDQSMTHQLRVREISSESYQGSELRTLIWENFKQVFVVICEELYSHFPSPNEGNELETARRLLGVVTSRTVSSGCVSNSAAFTASAGLNAGDPSGTAETAVGGKNDRRIQEAYRYSQRVTALRFIVFPIECTGEDEWRIYEGFNVGESIISEDEENFALETRDTDEFYRAQKWIGDPNAKLVRGSFKEISYTKP